MNSPQNSKAFTPTIILCRPQMGENIGATARAMANFGLTDLRLVAPRDGWPNQAAIDTARSALPIIENTRVYGSTAEASKDIHYILAATARSRQIPKPCYAPNLSATILYQHLTNKEGTAILFGPENNGLSNEDMTLADAIVTIPMSDIYPSMNISQAVCILAYEWFKHVNEVTEYSPALHTTCLASKFDIEGFFQHLETALDGKHYFKVDEKREKMMLTLKNIFVRAELTEQDVRSLRGILTALQG